MSKFTKLQLMLGEALNKRADDQQVVEVIDTMAEWFELLLEDMGIEPVSIPSLLRWQYLHSDAGQESRTQIARAIFLAFDVSACERGICDGPVLAAAFKEAINQLQESPGIINCSRLLYIAEALEEIDHAI
jgi:hypothetical protein